MTNQAEFPIWDRTNPKESLMQVHQWAIKNAQKHIEWYRNRSKIRKTLSQLLRITVILNITAGALCPLIDATGVFINEQPGADSIILGKWGYVFMALAAAIAGFDKYFGLSTGWMRFIVTQLSLERVLAEFHYDWAVLLDKQQEGQSKSNTILLQRVKDFSLKVDELVKQETDSWVLEFQSNLAELEKVLKTEAETRKLGSLKVKVANAKEFEKIAISLNHELIKELDGVTETLIEAVAPKQYEVMVVGTKNNHESKESKVIEVKSNSMASVEINLPPVSVKD